MKKRGLSSSCLKGEKKFSLSKSKLRGASFTVRGERKGSGDDGVSAEDSCEGPLDLRRAKSDRAAPRGRGESAASGGSSKQLLARPGTSGGKSTRRGSERGAERKALSAAVRALGPKAEAAALALSDFWAEAGVASGERLFGMLPSHAVIAIAEGRTGKKPLERLNRPLAGLASVALHDAIVPLAQQCVVCHDEWDVLPVARGQNVRPAPEPRPGPHPHAPPCDLDDAHGKTRTVAFTCAVGLSKSFTRLNPRRVGAPAKSAAVGPRSHAHVVCPAARSRCCSLPGCNDPGVHLDGRSWGGSLEPPARHGDGVDARRGGLDLRGEGACRRPEGAGGGYGGARRAGKGHAGALPRQAFRREA